eukprot:g29686.t1
MQRSASFYSNCCRYQICVCRSASCELKKVMIATHLISDCVFAQGITKLEHLNLSHMGLQDQDLNHIQGWTPNVLHTLDLRANQLTSLPPWLGSKQFGSLKKLLLFCSARDRKWVVVGGGGCLCLAGGESGAVERGMACGGVGREGARSSPTTLHIAQSFIEVPTHRAQGAEGCPYICCSQLRALSRGCVPMAPNPVKSYTTQPMLAKQYAPAPSGVPPASPGCHQPVWGATSHTWHVLSGSGLVPFL